MKIDLRKQSSEIRQFRSVYSSADGEVTFEGQCRKKDGFVIVEGRIVGRCEVVCDITGVVFFDTLDEEVKLKLVSDAYKGFDVEFDIIECDDEVFDCDIFLQEEIESFRLGYHRQVSNDEDR